MTFSSDLVLDEHKFLQSGKSSLAPALLLGLGTFKVLLSEIPALLLGRWGGYLVSAAFGIDSPRFPLIYFRKGVSPLMMYIYIAGCDASNCKAVVCNGEITMLLVFAIVTWPHDALVERTVPAMCNSG